jgi:hypothetical protein
MLLEPFLYDLVAEHQRALRETAERGRAGARGRDWWRRLRGASATAALHPVGSMASRRLCRGRRLACWRTAGHAVVGNDV